MCGRYYLASEDMDRIITSLLRSLDAPGCKMSGEIFPGDTAPVIAPNRARESKAFAMQWGFSLGKGKRLINARSESALEKPMFKESMRIRRCLIPASFYFEWGQEDKTKYMFRPAEGKGVCMAGIYRPEPGGRYAYAVLTRDAAPSIRQLHPRMPVILPSDACLPWLHPETDPDTLLKKACLDMIWAPAEQISLDKWTQDRLY